MSIEITACAGVVLLALAVAAYLLHRAYATIEAQADALDVYKRALDGERKAHRGTHARLVAAQRVYREECL